jgi:hypothetical protein
VSEIAVIVEPTDERPAAPSPAEQRPVRRIPARRRRRFVAGLRFNLLRYLTLAVTLSLAWGLVHLATWIVPGTPQATFLLVLAGGVLAAAGKTAIDILRWAEENRQAVHAERVRGVQRVFERACAVREQAIMDWRRIHTILVDNLTGQPQQIRLFHDHDETDRQGEKLLRKAMTEEIWIRAEGVDAVRTFKKDIAAIDYEALKSEDEFVAEFNALMQRLRRDLALAAIGIPLR